MERLPDEPLDPQMPSSAGTTAEPAQPPLLPAKRVTGLLPSRTSGGPRQLAPFGGMEQVLDAVDAIADRIAEVIGIRSRAG